ncbi:hypothetical protein Tco_0895964 [Tanacetum coccineum]|uniref:Uncharacterized protein n=1 Tax=Tanacetum coccineum TaxID=301880 RepID=A0ABQ5CIU2_9ASTR
MINCDTLFIIPSKASARLTPQCSMPPSKKAMMRIFTNMIQVILLSTRSRKNKTQEKIVALVYEHLAAEEIEKLDECYLFAHLKKRFMPWTSSDQLADNLHECHMKTLPFVGEKRKKTTKEETERLISKAILQERGRMQAQISSQIQNAIDNAIPSLFDASDDPLLHTTRHSNLFGSQSKLRRLQVPQTLVDLRLFLQEIRNDPMMISSRGENSAKKAEKTIEVKQEQDDEIDFWTDSYASEMMRYQLRSKHKTSWKRYLDNYEV